MFLEECKYIFKLKKIPKYMTDDIGNFSDQVRLDEENSKEESSSEKRF